MSAPLSPGHTLVIPKERQAFVHELSDESAAAIGRVLPRLSRAVMKATGTRDYNILQNNGAAAHHKPSCTSTFTSFRRPSMVVWEWAGPQAISRIAEAAELVDSIRAALDREA